MTARRQTTSSEFSSVQTDRPLRVLSTSEVTEGELVSRISDLKKSFLECRTIGHSWRLSFIGPVSRAGDEDLRSRALSHPFRPDGARVLLCSRCRTERVDLVYVGYGRETYSYRMVGRSYRYPDDYQVEGGLGPDRHLLHEELFRREETR